MGEFNQNSKYHDLTLEKHTEKAVNRALEQGYNNNIIEALKYHDIGKPYVVTVDKDGYNHYIGHAKLSAKLYKGSEYVQKLILFHDNEITKKFINKHGVKFCRDLLRVKECDRYAHSEYVKAILSNIKRVAKEVKLVDEFYRDLMLQGRLQADYSYLTEQGYTVIGVFLQGSQNYNLDTDQSDIDTKAIVLPSFNYFVNCKRPVSTTYVEDDGSLCDIKDIRIMFDTFLKSNINFLEILFSKYRVLNKDFSVLFGEVLKARDKIAVYDVKRLLNSICGMALEKDKALQHPYPTTRDKIEKYGYDPKQLHHILRLNEFLDRFVSGESFRECLISKQRDYLTNIKRGVLAEEAAVQLAKTVVVEMKEKKDNFIYEREPSQDKSCFDLLTKVKTDILREHFKKELVKNGQD